MNVEKEDLSAFQCRRCGACCKWEGPVRVTEQEIDAIADYLGIELQRFIRDYTYLTPDRRSLSLLEKEDGSCFYYGYLYLFKDKLRYGWQKKEYRSIYSYEQYWRRTC